MVAVHGRMLLASLPSWIFDQQAGLRQMYVEMRVSLNSNAKAKKFWRVLVSFINRIPEVLSPLANETRGGAGPGYQPLG